MRATVVLALMVIVVGSHTAPAATRPQEPAGERATLRLAFLGDSGTGGSRQAGVRDQLETTSATHRLDAVILLGDNVYENGEAANIGPSFLTPYRGLLDEGIPFYAALGNHDVQKCVATDIDPVPRDAAIYDVGDSRCEVDRQLATIEFGYPDGRRYYSVALGGAPPVVEVFVIDTNTLPSSQTKLAGRVDTPQLEWLDRALDASEASWKVVAMHHPIYSPTASRFGFFSGHGSEIEMRRRLEPLFRERVDVVFQGHNHLYARMRPQQGIRYFVAGGGGKGTYKFKPDELTEPRDDRGNFNHFVVMKASDERIDYCTIDAAGGIRDGGSFTKGSATDAPTAAGSCAALR